jgi:glycosyltransferase involved in cell wall biosynthesis
MRVAYFTESILPLVDGVSITLDHLFEDLEERGLDFRVHAPFEPPKDRIWARRVRTLPSVAFPLHRDYRLTVPWGRGLGRELDEWAPDLVHVVSPTPAGGWARRYARRRSLPLVATFHTHFVAYFSYYRVGLLERLGWWLLRRAYAPCDLVFTPSEAIARQLRSHEIGPVRIWGRGIDTRVFSPRWRDDELRTSVGASDRRPLLLMVSRLVKEKDLLDLPPMARELDRRDVSYRLVLVGDGPLRAELEEALPDAVLAGYQEGEALSRWYASADVFVFPSTTETFGNVVQESLASGVPAVVVDQGGPQTVIEPGETGLVARANDPRHLAETVATLLEDADRRRSMAAAARRQTEGRSWHTVNEDLIDGYRELIARKAGEGGGSGKRNVA